MNPGDQTPLPQDPQESTAEILADVVGLIEEATTRITDEEVENRLRRLLNRVEPPEQGGGGPHNHPSAAVEPYDEPGTGSVGVQVGASAPADLDRAAFSWPWRLPSMLLSVAQRSAARSKAAQIVAEARETADEIIEQAREQAVQLTTPAQPASGLPAVTADNTDQQQSVARGAVRHQIGPMALRPWFLSGVTALNSIGAMLVIGGAVTGTGAVIAIALSAALLALLALLLMFHHWQSMRLNKDTAPALSTGLSVRAALPDVLHLLDQPDQLAHTFWVCLTPAEQQALTACAQQRTFRKDAPLCREGETSDQVLVLRSGWVKVCQWRGGGERIIAVRGPGDLIGERAIARPARTRSATVVALDDVQALSVSSSEFAMFLAAHPRVVSLIEQQIYDRLSEASWRETLQDDPDDGSPTSWEGQNCSVILTDIAGFRTRYHRDQDRRRVRQVMYELLQESFETSGVPRPMCHWEDRGDGALVVIPPAVPAHMAADQLIAHLSAALYRYNHQATETTRLRLRVAFDVGPVVSDTHGVSGQAVVQAARLLETPVFKQQLGNTTADLAFIASSFVYDVLIRHNLRYADPTDFQRVEVSTRESTTTAWFNLFDASPSPSPIRTPCTTTRVIRPLHAAMWQVGPPIG